MTSPRRVVSHRPRVPAQLRAQARLLDPVSVRSPLGKWEANPQVRGYQLACCDLRERTVTNHATGNQWREVFTEPAYPQGSAAAWVNQCTTPGRGRNLSVATAAILDAAMRGYIPWTSVRWSISTYINTWERQGLEYGM